MDVKVFTCGYRDWKFWCAGQVMDKYFHAEEAGGALKVYFNPKEPFDPEKYFPPEVKDELERVVKATRKSKPRRRCGVWAIN